MARKLQDELNSCNSREIIDVPPSPKNQAAMTPNGNYALINDHKDVVHELASQVKHNKHFFIVTRRKAAFSRIISLWQTSLQVPPNKYTECPLQWGKWY